MSDSIANTTFRVAVSPTESVTPTVDTTNSVVPTNTPNDLVATYSEEHGKPYVAKYLAVEEIANEPEFKRDLGEIEGFIKDRVTNGKLDNSTHATDKYLKELEKKAGLTGYENTNKRISSLLAYIDFIRKIES
jgi:hypothetical protein